MTPGNMPMLAADWQSLSSELGLATRVGTIADLMQRPGFSRTLVAVPDSLEQLVGWGGGVWGRMTAELAQWFAVLFWASPDQSALIGRHITALCAAGWYPDTLRRDAAPVMPEQRAADEAAALALYQAWDVAGRRFLSPGISTAQTKLRAEAQAAAWRAEADTVPGGFVRALDVMNTEPAPLSRTMTRAEIMLSDPTCPTTNDKEL